MTKPGQSWGIHIYIIKKICNKPIANIILHKVELRAFPPKSGIIQGCLPSLFLFNAVLARAIRSEGDKGNRKEKFSFLYSPRGRKSLLVPSNRGLLSRIYRELEQKLHIKIQLKIGEWKLGLGANAFSLSRRDRGREISLSSRIARTR